LHSRNSRYQQRGYHLPKFSGRSEDHVETFFIQFETCSKAEHWSADERLVHLRMALTGEASTLITAPGAETCKGLLKLLMTHYGKDSQQASCEAQLLQYRRKPGETIQHLKMHICRLAQWAHPGESASTSGMFRDRLIECFVNALNDPVMAQDIYRQGPDNIDKAADLAVRFEKYYASNKLLRSGGNSSTSHASSADHSTSTSTDHMIKWKSARQGPVDLEVTTPKYSDNTSTITASGQQASKFVAPLRRPDHHNRGNVEHGVYQRTNADQKQPPVCYTCGQQGHISWRCPQAPAANRPNPRPQFSTATYRDSNTGSVHFGNREQPTASFNRTGGGPAQYHSANSCHSVSVDKELKCFVDIYVGNRCLPVLADTGCSLSCMNKYLVPPGTKIEPKQLNMKAANSTMVRIIGEVNLVFKFTPDGPTRVHKIVLSPDIDGVIFGLDLLQRFKRVWDMRQDYLVMDGQPVQLHPHHGGPEVRRVYASSAVTVQPYNEYDVPVDIPFRHSSDRAPTLVLEARKIQPGLAAASVAVPGYTSHCKVKVMNICNRPRTIHAGTFLGLAQPFSSTLHKLDQKPADSIDRAQLDNAYTAQGLVNNCSGINDLSSEDCSWSSVSHALADGSTVHKSVAHSVSSPFAAASVLTQYPAGCHVMNCVFHDFSAIDSAFLYFTDFGPGDNAPFLMPAFHA
jgi:hypothetical protein